MAGQSQKAKILYLMKILLEKTDEEHLMSAADLARELNFYGISAERKSIYTDIEVLKTFGIDIVQVKGGNAGYYVASREFEMPELKLLVDAVQASRFITKKKTEELIGKLEKLTSEASAKELQRQIYIYNRTKAGNETIYNNVDYIHTAINSNQQIAFKYAEWTVKKTLELKKNGTLYEVSPWSLTWDDENYYLIAFDEKVQSIRHYRVDKMQSMRLVEKERNGREQFQNFNLASFANKTFGMYGGKDYKVTLECSNKIAGVILDRFGQDVMMIPSDQESFHVHVLVAVSPQFYGWLTGLGDLVKIVGPEEVKEDYVRYLGEIMRNYQ